MTDKQDLYHTVRAIQFLSEHGQRYGNLLALLRGELDELEEAAKKEIEEDREEKKREQEEAETHAASRKEINKAPVVSRPLPLNNPPLTTENKRI